MVNEKGLGVSVGVYLQCKMLSWRQDDVYISDKYSIVVFFKKKIGKSSCGESLSQKKNCGGNNHKNSWAQGTRAFLVSTWIKMEIKSQEMIKGQAADGQGFWKRGKHFRTKVEGGGSFTPPERSVDSSHFRSNMISINFKPFI